MRVKIDGKFFELEAKKCSFLGKIRGLMFRRSKKAPALVFDFKKPTRVPIHSFFVFFPFFAIWLDGKKRITEIKKIFPFSPNIAPKEDFSRLIEIPVNEKYAMISELLSAKEKSRRQKV